MPKLVDYKRRKHYHTLRFEHGVPRSQAAKEAGVSYTWAQQYDRGVKTARDPEGGWSNEPNKSLPAGPVPLDQLCDEAKRALVDFEYFRLRYFGHISSPWQVEAAEEARVRLASPHKEFLLQNCPPGSGKTLLFTHDIPAWLTVQNRAIRGLIGSHTQKAAEMYVGRLRRTFERTRPIQAKDRDLRLGLAKDAESTLALDFGPFKPDNPDIWTRGVFTVLQFGETPTDEKEATWTAFGQDSSQIGWRVEFIAWDDVVTPRTLRSVEQVERQQVWWDDEAETRLEPTGLLVLQGQRLGSNDLYAYCRDKTIVPDEEDEFDDDAPRVQQYTHISYKAHYPELCTGKHHPSEVKAYPEGCLLDPVRLPWRDLRAVMSKGQKFQVLYQQEDVDPEDVLVPKVWVDGGKGADGTEYPGCWDRDRDICQIPRGLTEPTYSVVSADPSPTRFWSIQWWLYNKPSELRYLLDLERRAMDAPDFLDYNPATSTYTGLLEDWWLRSSDLGRPFKWLIVEANAAQRFMLQYTHFKQWAAKRKVHLIPHQTTRNKLDENYGVVASLKPQWRHGRVRLPGKQPPSLGRTASLKLIDEVTRWPGGNTDDCVMAQWFFEYHIPRIAVPDKSTWPKLWTPSWMRGSAA